MAGDKLLRADITQRMRSDYRRQEVRLQVLDDEELIKAAAEAAGELEYRLSKQGLSLPPRTRSRTSKRPLTRAAPTIRREANPREMMIVRAVARTWGAAQFGCSPNGSVFTADTDGWSWPPERGRRDDVTGLSTLLDDVAALFNSELRRGGVGGRFYERDGSFFDADDGAVFLEVKITRTARFVQAKPVSKLLHRLAARRRRGTGTRPRSA